MRPVKIITDSCADLNKKLLEKYNIDYAQMSTVYQGVESPALLTWTEQDAHELYELIRAGERITTAQVSVEEFTNVFEKYLHDGYNIVYIGCSSKQSGSVNTGRLTADKLLQHYPEAEIYCIDSLNATIGEGMLAIEAAKLAARGKSAAEIAEKITAIRKTVLQFATVHSLDTLKRAGRVSATSAFFGNLMGVKPILTSDANGVQTAFKKVKGRNAAIRECVELIKKNIIDAEKQTIYLWHSDCDREELEEVRKLVTSELCCHEVEIGSIGPIIGASVGPDVIALFAFGKEVTFVAQT